MTFGHFRGKSSLGAEWRIFAVLIVAVSALLGSLNGLGHPDQLIYDNLIRSVQRPVPNDIVIVAIDDFSIAGLGRWPWPRRTHAQLLDFLSDSGAVAVGMDIIFSEPEPVRQDGQNDDGRLVASLTKNGRTVLPLIIERSASGLTTTAPLPEFAEAARGLGYTHFRFEDDGVLRSIYLRESLYGQWWSQFALSVYNVGNPARPEADQYGILRAEHGMSPREAGRNVWQRDHHQRIPYFAPSGHFQTVSYIDVLSGRIPKIFFAGKYVLVGATAPGVASAFTTPFTSGYRAMSGIEINANILAGLLENKRIVEAGTWQSMLFTALAALGALLACRYFSPVRALAATVLLAAAIIFLSYALFQFDFWLPPAAALLVVLSIYPLWSWRRLEAALAFLSEEFTRLNQNSTAVLRRPVAAPRAVDADFMDRRITVMRQAADQARDLQQFVIDNLNSMPDAALVLSQDGALLMLNDAARDYIRTLRPRGAAAPTFEDIFSKFEMPLVDGAATTWRDALLNSSSTAAEIETRDVNGKEFLVKSAPSRAAGNETLCWIVLLIDVSSLRAAERHRDESLNFISHDMRAPQSSILALLELQKNPSTAFPQEEFFSRIEKSVQTTLTLAEDFVQLAQADAPTYQWQEADFSSLLADAVDDIWAFARNREIEILIESGSSDDSECWISADRSLMVRAIGNLLSNAVKFSPQGSKIVCSVGMEPIDGNPFVVCRIKDQGKGIEEKERKRIFSRSARMHGRSRDGLGLGLVFVKTVIERHGGSIDFKSQAGKGTTFVFKLPCISDNAG